MLSRFSRFLFPLALALPAAWLALDRTDAEAAVVRERIPASATLLQLEGTPVGTLRAAAGGTAVGTVTSTDVGQKGGPARKHIISVQYEELQLELDLSLDRQVYDWIAAAWAGNDRSKAGTLVSLDSSGNAKNAREFRDAYITEVTFPALDAASKEAAFITLVLSPASVKSVALPAGKAPVGAARSKGWSTSNFKLEIDGLDTSRVARIDPIQVKQPVSADSVGKLRDVGRSPGAVQFGNLRVTLSEVGADSWRAWHEDFLIKGNSADKNERSGRVIFLAPNLKDELARIELSNLGIFALRAKPLTSGVSQLEAELYVERMAFSVAGK